MISTVTGPRDPVHPRPELLVAGGDERVDEDGAAGLDERVGGNLGAEAPWVPFRVPRGPSPDAASEVLHRGELRAIVTRRRGLAALAVAALTLAGCSSSGDEPRAPGDVVHVRVRFAGAPGFEEQWVELRTGRYRLQSPDGREWWVFDGRRGFEDRISGATTLRIGSRLYLDGLATMSVRELLAAYYLHGRGLVPGHGGHVLALRRHGHTIATITIAGGIFERAGRRARPVRDPARPRNQHRPGGPGGRALQARHRRLLVRPTMARTLGRDRVGYRARLQASAERVHIVFYEPADAGNRSSAYANSPAPRGEVQVVSLDRGSHLARRHIQTTRGHPGGPPEPPWPSRRLTLADGERVVVIPFRYRTADGFRQPGFYVLTARTLVSVNTGLGMRSALRLAADLRPTRLGRVSPHRPRRPSRPGRCPA